MEAFRAYVNKAEGNEHARVIDIRAQEGLDLEAGKAKLEEMLEADEVIDQVVTISGMTVTEWEKLPA